MTLDQKASLTRRLSVVSAIRDIQNKLVAFKINGYHLESWFDERILTEIRLFEAKIDGLADDLERSLNAPEKEPGADVETSAPGLN